jgi:hypothetical protein
MAGVRGDIKIHDSCERDNEQDEEKEVKPEAQTPRGWQDFLREYSLHRVLHLFILQKGPRRLQKHFVRGDNLSLSLLYLWIGINRDTVSMDDQSGGISQEVMAEELLSKPEL